MYHMPHAMIWRLYANKPITAGDGGWVHAKDQKHHDRLKSLINHGFVSWPAG